MEFTGDMAVTFGRSVGEDGDYCGAPEVRIDTSETVPKVDIAIPLSDADNGDSRVVNAMLPLADLEAALAYLKSGMPDDEAA